MKITTSLNLLDVLSLADLIVFLLILALTVGVVFWGHSRLKVASGFLEHLLMGRALTLPLFIATLVATWYGGIFGVTEIAYEHGLYNFITQGIFWYITYLLFAFFLVDKIRQYQSVTLPELVKMQFGPKAGYLAAVFNFFNVVPIAYAISVGLFLQLLLGWPLVYCVALGTSLVCLYAIFGGFRAIVYSDLVQFAVMCTSVVLVIVFSWKLFGGLEYLRMELPQSHFSLTGGQSILTTLVWGFIALSTLVDPNFYQRCFAAKNGKVAKKGIIVAALIWCVFDLCTTFGGMYARAALQTAELQNAYLIYAMQVLPAGIRGFFLAGILATILSTLDSYIFIASNTITYDILPKRYKEKLFCSYLGIVFVGILAIGLSAYFDGSIKTVWKTFGSYSAGCLLIPMLIGFIKPKLISDNGFLIGCLFGAIGITYWRIAHHTGIWANIDELYIGMFCTCLGLLGEKLTRTFLVRF